jgi:hypothetical protein
LGFASVLADFGLPIYQFVPALIGFNVGVELGSNNGHFNSFLCNQLLVSKTKIGTEI